jgi:hypothetical protein
MTAALFVLAAAAAGPASPRAWIGEKGLALAREATQVEVLRVEHDARRELPDRPPRLSDFDVKARRVIRDAAVVSRLAALLGDHTAWSASDQEPEIFFSASDLALRMQGAGGTLELLVCSWCRLVAVPWGDGGRVFEIKAQRDLLDLVLQAFPDDRVLAWRRVERMAAATKPADVLGSAADVLAGADRAEALGVKPRPPGARPLEIADLQVTRTQPLEPSLAKRLAKELGEAGTYEFGPTKRCIFVPNVAFRIHNGGATAEVVLCFGCAEMVVNAIDASGTPVHLSRAYFKGDGLWALAAAALGEAELKKILKEARP